MASFRQHGNGWQARIRRQGQPGITKTFESRADADRWARAVESSIDKGQFFDINEAQRTTLGDCGRHELGHGTGHFCCAHHVLLVGSSGRAGPNKAVMPPTKRHRTEALGFCRGRFFHGFC